MDLKEKIEDDFDDEAFFRAAEKDQARINRQLFFLKIKQILLKVQYFPALVKNFIKYTLIGLIKLWGVVLVLIILLFLYFSDSYSSIYYRVNITFEKNNNDYLREIIQKKQVELKESDKKLSCYKNQFTRIANSENVII
jgi:hypothetical protein